MDTRSRPAGGLRWLLWLLLIAPQLSVPAATYCFRPAYAYYSTRQEDLAKCGALKCGDPLHYYKHVDWSLRHKVTDDEWDCGYGFAFENYWTGWENYTVDESAGSCGACSYDSYEYLDQTGSGYYPGLGQYHFHKKGPGSHIIVPDLDEETGDPRDPIDQAIYNSSCRTYCAQPDQDSYSSPDCGENSVTSTTGCWGSNVTTSVRTYSNEYTTGKLLSLARKCLQQQAYPSFVTDPGCAYRSLATDESSISLRGLKYYFSFPSVAWVRYTVTWTERTYPTDFAEGDECDWKPTGGAHDEQKCEVVIGTGDLVSTCIHEIPPPQGNSYVVVVNVRVCFDFDINDCPPADRRPPRFPALASPAKCCGGSDRALPLGGGGVSLNGVTLDIGLGRSGYLFDAGSLSLSEVFPTANVSSPAAAKLNCAVGCSGTTADAVADSSGNLRQVMATQALADIVTVDTNRFDIVLYPASQIGAKNLTTGLYPTNGASPIVTWSVVSPDAAQTGDVSTNYYRVFVIETRSAVSRTNQFQYLSDRNGWALTYPDGLRKERRWAVWNPGTSQSVETFEVLNPTNDAVLYHEEATFAHSSHQDNLIGARRGLASSQQVDQWQYADANAPDSPSYHLAPDGSWEHYVYDTSGRVTEMMTGFRDYAYQGTAADANNSRRRVLSYAPVDSGDAGTSRPQVPRSQTEYLLGTVIGKVARSITDYQLVEQRYSAASAAWNGAQNLSTRTLYYSVTDAASGAIAGLISSVAKPDGTGTFYKYADSGGQRTTTVRTGWMNGGGTDVTAGKQTVTVVAVDGRLLSSVTTDIASGLTTASATYGNFDPVGRAQLVTYLGGLTEQFQYVCCGLDTYIDREGTSTGYVYDSLKRQIASTTAGITTTNIYGPSGNLLAVQRIGSDGSAILQAGYAYDDAGRMTYQTNGVGAITAFADDLSQGYLIRTTTDALGTADQVTHIERYYRDGQLAETSGTADNPMRYDYGLLADNGTQAPYRLAISLTAAGTATGTNEWVATVSDFLGRGYKTIYADATPASLTDNPVSLSYYDSQGRLAKTVDPDGVTTLYSHPNYTDTITAIDMNLNGVIDYSGTDRITKVVTDVTTDWGYPVRRTTTYDYTLMNSATATVTSVSETSVDGFRSWQTVVGVANPVTSVTAYPGGGARNVTVTASDGSYTLSSYANGRLQSVTRKLADGTQIGRTTYLYDTHGRQWKATDARNGTAVYAYDNADQMTVVTLPQAGNGQAAQATATAYDYLGRVKQVTEPDGTMVYTEYYPGGQTKHAWGSRTYPVEYAYDAQGRTTSLKTYRAFSGSWTSPGTADTTSWTYDAYRGWLNNKRQADGTGPDYTYKPSGRMQKRQWARGSPRTETVWGYNNAGDVASITYNNDANLTPDITYGYDRHGCQTTVTSAGTTGTWTVSRTSGLQRNLLSEAYGGTHPLAGLSVNATYDTILRRATVNFQNGLSVLDSSTYGYDTASRLTSVSDGTHSANYAYLANSPLPDTVTFKQGATTRLTTVRKYDYLNRLLQIQNSAGAPPMNTYAYQYNEADQRTGVTLGDGSFWYYQYDALGQVISGRRSWAGGPPVPGQQYEYAFDTIGNRTGAGWGGNASGAGLRSATYTANGLNQYATRTVPGSFDVLGLAAAASTVSVNGVAADYRRGEYFQKSVSVSNASGPVWQPVSVTTSGGGSSGGNMYVPATPESFAYDLDGNLTSDGRWTYVWDAENRLVSMQSISAVPAAAKQKLDFAYDDAGRRIQKQVSNWNGSAFVAAGTTRYLYDGWNLVGEVDGAGNLLRSYQWGTDLGGRAPGSGGVGGLVSVKPNGAAAQFAGYDGNGNVTVLVDGATGAFSAGFEYGPFGEVIRLTGPQAAANPFRFSTRYADTESGLLYYGYRFYNPSAGRWMSRDLLAEDGGSNLQGLARNDLVNSFDVLGMYQVDFHYYVIQYLLKTLCYSSATAADVAWASQHVDDDYLTNPLYLGAMVRAGHTEFAPILRDFHFYGSSPKAVTRRNPPDLAATVAATAGPLRDSGDSFQASLLGDYLHTYADSWSHEGFTAWDNKRKNNRGYKYVEMFGHMVPAFIAGYVGHTNPGERPDVPYLNVPKAVQAAKTIRTLLPNLCGCAQGALSNSQVEGDLRTGFIFHGTEKERAEHWKDIIFLRFKDVFVYEK